MTTKDAISILIRMLVGLGLIAVVAAFAFQAGMSQGVGQSLESGQPPAIAPWAFGFSGPFSLIGTLCTGALFLALFFAAFRFVFCPFRPGRRRWNGGDNSEGLAG